LENYFAIKGAKIIGLKKSDLAKSIYAELKGYRVNPLTPPSKGPQTDKRKPE